jgi:hypothetical protein
MTRWSESCAARWNEKEMYMENEIVLTDEMKIELGESLAALASGHVMLEGYFAKLDAKAEQQDAKIVQLMDENRELKRMVGALVDKITLLRVLVDSHQGDIQILKKYLPTGGIVQ